MAKLSGRTGHSFAQLLNDQATHSIIESLYLRFDLSSLVTEATPTPNKLTKATHLVKSLSAREDDSLRELIEYAASPSSKMGTTFRRGSAESLDLWANFDKDLEGSVRATARTAAPPARERQFPRPGTTAPAPTHTQDHAPSAKRLVFVVRGRDQKAYDALASLLLALDLRIVTWDEAVRGVEGGTPHTLDIVRAGIDMSDAVVVLMTPDDLGQVKDEFGQATDDPREGRPTGQVRQNVVFEAGWAMAINQGGVILVRVGDVRNLSDIDGLNYVNLTNDISARRSFIARLRNCKLAVDDSGEAWRTAGLFPQQ